MPEPTPLRFYTQAVNPAPAVVRRHAASMVAAVAGALLCLLAAVHGFRAAVAQSLFARVRSGMSSAKVRNMLDVADLSQGLYPYNYGLCVLCADAAFMESLNTTGPDSDSFMKIARTWCDRGLELNPYDRRLVFRKMGILGAAPDTRSSALDMWKQFTDWNFWNPDNHFYLGMMYVMSGELEKAKEEVFWARGSAYYSRLVRSIEEATAGRGNGSPSVGSPGGSPSQLH